MNRTRYRPLSTRHMAIFAIATAVAVAIAIVIASSRMSLIGWWLANCSGPTSACTWARIGFTWWWVVMFAAWFAVAAMAHIATKDRLAPLDEDGATQPPGQ